VGWIFAGIAQFEARVTGFLAEGASRDERLMLVTDDPRADRWPESLVRSGQLVIAGTSDVYGPDRLVDAGSQRATFEAAVAEARREGYAGLRVAADNTSLVLGPERREAWTEWEHIADDFIRDNPFTGLCAFDREQLTADDVRLLRGLHSAEMHA